MRWLLLPLMVGCSGEWSAPDHTAPGSDIEAAEPLADCGGVVPEVLAVTDSRLPQLANAYRFEIELDLQSDVFVACTLAGDDSEVLLLESPADTLHDLTLFGLLSDASYDCVIAPSCAEADVYTLGIETGSMPLSLPWASTDYDPQLEVAGGPYTLANHMSGGDESALVVFDLDGEIRWYYDDLPDDIAIAVEARYHGNGQFVWGGGDSRLGAPQVIQADHDRGYVTQWEGSRDAKFFHDGKMLDDGRMMSITLAEAQVRTSGGTGFELRLVDPANSRVEWLWHSDSAVSQGVLPPATGNDPYHPNWVDLQVDGDTELAWISLDGLRQTIAVDVATGEVVVDFGPDGEFELSDSFGRSLSHERDWPNGQHGLEIDGDRMLVYDNGREVGRSRIVEYSLDSATGKAVELWDWSEPDWFEEILGDVDYLPNGRALITQAHWEGFTSNPGDVTSLVELDMNTQEVVWRLDFDSKFDGVYRAERINACDVFPNGRLCPAIAARLISLAPLLER